MTLQEATDKLVAEQIKEFHFYIDALSLAQAKELTLESTVLVAVRKYVEAYHEL